MHACTCTHLHMHAQACTYNTATPTVCMLCISPPPDDVRGAPPYAPAGTQRDVLQLEPPQWQPDSGASHCAGCHKPFQPLRRLRHHCRLCGRIYCAACCGARLLLPPRFRASEPQRVCEMCEGLLAPLQGFLVGAAAASVQPPVHDALDSVSLRSWLNAPYSSSMQVELYKAANILQAYVKARCCAALTACLCSAVCCELLTHSSCLTLTQPFMPATMLCYDIHLKPMEPLLQCTRSHYDCMQSNLFLCL